MLTSVGPTFPPTRARGVVKAGLQFEKAFCGMMGISHGPTFFPHQWMHYQNDSGWHWCQPDGILAQPDEGRLLVFECKLKHTYRSYYQLHDLYLPVLRVAFPDLKPIPITVVKYFDPAIPYPGKIHLMKSLDDLPTALKTGVYIWR